MKPGHEHPTTLPYDDTLTVGSGVVPRADSTAPELPGRYEDLGSIAGGSFGEVRRVRDTLLDRIVAMKLLRAEHADVAHVRRRFLVEAQITAGLQHPGIVAVYDRGELEGGRLWFTMKEVRGRTLRDVIAELHAHKGPDGFASTPSGWTFRRVVDAFARIAQAIAYAHSRGVVHRDLKPDNLMVGEFGEVLVMDWGLARRAGVADAAGGGIEGSSRDSSPELTRHGDILGTPAYMSPEQARGDAALHGPATDIYALGAVLYCVLTGQAPYRGGTVSEVLAAIAAGMSVRVRDAAPGGPPLPEELVALCEHALSSRIEDRPESAEALAEEVVAWLDGVRRREQALAVLAQARTLEPEIAVLRAQAEEAQARARAMKSDLRPYDPVEKKRPAWSLEDESARLGRAAAITETKWMEVVQGALSLDPDLPEAHAALADHHRARLVEAEVAHRDEDAARAEEMLRAHARGRHTAFLRGDGALTLVTDPPGAEVVVERYVPQDRRLLPVYERTLGPTPLIEAPLVQGSYLLRIRAPGRAEVRYPVLIERAGHWDGRAPGEGEPSSIVLPAEGELGLNDVYVPPGWCWIGGDPDATDGLPRRRIWIDGFVMHGSPVTTAEYLAFLNDLVTNGREDEAMAASPRLPGGDEPALLRDGGGLFELPPDREGLRWRLDWPVALVDWHAASAYLRWLAERTKQPWRMPNELEREKAARGADGRLAPWGDHLDATFTCALESHRGRGRPEQAAVGTFPADESPYGIRGLAGHVRDWCINVWKTEGPVAKNGRLSLDPAPPEDDDFRIIRGGAWVSTINTSRAAARFGARPRTRWHIVGLRGARAYSSGARASGAVTKLSS